MQWSVLPHREYFISRLLTKDGLVLLYWEKEAGCDWFRWSDLSDCHLVTPLCAPIELTPTPSSPFPSTTADPTVPLGGVSLWPMAAPSPGKVLYTQRGAATPHRHARPRHAGVKVLENSTDTVIGRTSELSSPLIVPPRRRKRGVK